MLRLITLKWADGSRQTDLPVLPVITPRTDLHKAIAAPIAHDQVLYLEFGVYRGDSIRHWCGLLQNPASHLQGFDSFEGLPEAWDAFRAAGTFSVQGKLPQFQDSRVVLHPGWFEDTLPNFVLPPHQHLIIHADADLYSSTQLVLRLLQDHIVPGTILIFDEFCDRAHELKAFDEYLKRTGDRFSFVGGTINLEQVAFRKTL